MLAAATFAAAALAWAPLPAAGLERTEVAAARIGGSIYVVGGFLPGGASTSAVERYDIRRRRWVRMRRMPLALNHTTATAHRGRLYVQGGYEGPLSQPTGALLRYNPETNRWRRLPAAPTPRAAQAAAFVGERLYVAGGANDSGSLRSLEIYNAARRRWTRGPSFPGPARNHTTGVASGGRFYVLAGRDSANLHGRGALRPAAQALGAAARPADTARRYRVGAAARRPDRRIRRRGARAGRLDDRAGRAVQPAHATLARAA